MKIKIYFAASIKGGREDGFLYKELICLFQSKGYDILTPHIGDTNLTNKGETKLAPSKIFKRDLSLLKQANILIAEVSTPSSGVGYEIGVAESLKIPVICLIQNSKKESISAIIEGNPYVHRLVYITPIEGFTICDSLINKLF